MFNHSLSCNHCGALLEVPEGTRYATCAPCASRLAIHRTATAWYTEELDSPPTHLSPAQRERLRRLRDELQRVDREWKDCTQALADRTAGGAAPLATEAAVVLNGIVPAIGIAVLTFVVGLFSPVLFFIGVMLIAAALMNTARIYGKAREYRDEEADYQRRRAAIEDEMRGTVLGSGARA
jgi:hypothetical protein